MAYSMISLTSYIYAEPVTLLQSSSHTIPPPALEHHVILFRYERAGLLAPSISALHPLKISLAHAQAWCSLLQQQAQVADSVHKLLAAPQHL